MPAGKKGAAQKTAGVLRSKLGALCPNHMGAVGLHGLDKSNPFKRRGRCPVV